MLLFQFAGYVSVFSENIDPRSILSSRDADASHIVGTAAKTRWYKDNGESAYGPFYYRVIHTFAFFVGREFARDGSAVEKNEMAHHLAAMTLSLVSIYGMAFLLSSLLIGNLAGRLAFSMVVTALFLSHPVWASFVFRAHPDHFFALVVLAAFLATAKAITEKENELAFKLAALLWGAAGMVKLSFVIFLPALMFLWMPPIRKDTFHKTVRFYLWMLPSYLALGFPQSFNFPRSIRFLINQSQYSLPATAASVSKWISELGSQLLWVGILVLSIALVTKKPANRHETIRLAAVILIPLIVLLKQNSEYQTDYYLFPIVAMILALAAQTVRGPYFLRAEKFQNLVLAGISLFTFLSFGFVPLTMEREMTPTLICREEAHKIYTEVHKMADEGKIVVVDPYVPYDRGRGRDQIKASWSNHWDRVRAEQADALVINTDYAGRFLTSGEPAHGVKVDVPEWQKVRIFYSSLKNEIAQDTNGQVWTKAMTVKCPWEIWIKDGQSQLPSDRARMENSDTDISGQSAVQAAEK